MSFSLGSRCASGKVEQVVLQQNSFWAQEADIRRTYYANDSVKTVLVTLRNISLPRCSKYYHQHVSERNVGP